MIKFVNKFIEVEDYVHSGVQPIFLMDYDPTYVYSTLTSPVNSQEDTWSITENGDKVRIPVFGYKSGKEPDSGLFGFGLQLGMQAITLIKRPFTHVVMVLGVERHDLSEDGDEAYRVYAGISFARKKGT